MTPVRIAIVLSAVTCLGAELSIGSRAPEFELRTVEGELASSASLRANAQVTVVGFVAAQCPVTNAYNQRMIALYKQFSSRGVAFVLVNSNSNETAEEMKLYAKQAALTYPVYRDAGNRVADLFGAQTTPEIFVLDAEGVVRYHGAIDDAQNEARVRVHGLRLAIEALLAGKQVEPARTKAFGYTLHRVRT